MLHTIHVALDGSPYANAALALALRWAKEYGATVLGHAPIDEPFITEAEAMPMGGAYFKGHVDEAKLQEVQARAEAVLTSFTEQCEAAGVKWKRHLDIGEPAALLRKQAEIADISVLGQKTYFHFEGTTNPCGTSDEFIQASPRPVVIVPESLPQGESIVVAYDGSAESAKAMHAFVATGLGWAKPIRVVTVMDTITEADKVAGRGVDYLVMHNLAAETRPWDRSKPIGDRLAEEVANAGLLVMGCFTHSALYQFFFGSTTKTVLKSIHVPVFLFH